MSGAEIERMVRDARRCARRAKRSPSREDLIAVIESAGPRLDAEDLRRVAVHEAGHAVAAPPWHIDSINVLRLKRPADHQIATTRYPNQSRLG